MSSDQLPINEWIVVFYPQTGATRLCPSIDFARNHLGAKSFLVHAYKSPNDFRVRHDHAKLEDCWKLVYSHHAWKFPKTAVGSLDDFSPEPPDCSTEEFARLLWDFVQAVGDRLTKPKMQVMGKPKEHYELKLGLMREAVENGTLKEIYNKQARTVFLALLETGKEFLNEEEIKKLIYGLVAARALKTKQEPWVIFQYYRPQFINDGYVVRGGKPRKSREQHGMVGDYF